MNNQTRIQINYALLSLLLAACSEIGSPAKESKDTFPPSPTSNASPHPILPVASPHWFVQSSGDPIDASPSPASDADCDGNPPDAGSDSDASICSGTVVIGHCLFDMATICQDYATDQSAECNARPLTSGWSSGPCGSDSLSDLSRSSGGCLDQCGMIQWSYPLGGGGPSAVSIAAVQEECQLSGQTYIATY